MTYEPRTVEEARRAVAESRERLSDTLGNIEDSLTAKKQELEAKVDVLRPVKKRVRSRPFAALAVAVGVGFLLSRFRNK